MSPVERLKKISTAASVRLNESFHAPDVVPYGAEALALIADHPEQQAEFLATLLQAAVVPEDGDVWFLQFCAHGLRWPELKAGLERLSSAAVQANDWNHVQRLGHILDAFEDNWEDADDFYSAHFRGERR